MCSSVKQESSLGKEEKACPDRIVNSYKKKKKEIKEKKSKIENRKLKKRIEHPCHEQEAEDPPDLT